MSTNQKPSRQEVLAFTMSALCVAIFIGLIIFFGLNVKSDQIKAQDYKTQRFKELSKYKDDNDGKVKVVQVDIGRSTLYIMIEGIKTKERKIIYVSDISPNLPLAGEIWTITVDVRYPYYYLESKVE